ncbi:MAG: tetratricopeptide repeat protein, partial [Treponema sp.]|nr:tetratricopeptide repeat protein [Treponema sp.]
MVLRRKTLIGVFAVLLCGATAFSQTPKARQFFDRGLQKQQRYDYYGASEDFQEALHINPAYGDAWFHLAQVSYELDDYNLTLNYLDNAEKYSRDNTEIMNLRGLVYIAVNRLQDARTVFEAMLKKHPNDVHARFGLAELDLFAGSLDGAKSLYIDALKRQSDNRKALLSLAVISAEEGHDDVSESYLLQALRYHSGDPQVHYLAGYLSARRGKMEEAERRARAAVQINGEYTKAYVLLASVLYSQSRYDEVIDICDYLIARNRNTTAAWYL